VIGWGLMVLRAMRSIVRETREDALLTMKGLAMRHD